MSSSTTIIMSSNPSIPSVSSLVASSDGTPPMAIRATLLKKLERTQSAEQVALQKLLSCSAELTMLQKQPLFQKFAKSTLSENAREFREYYKFEKHNPGLTKIGKMEKSLATTIRGRIYTVIKVQRKKEERERKLEELVEKEKEIAAEVAAVEKVIWERENDRVDARRNGMGRENGGLWKTDRDGRMMDLEKKMAERTSNLE